MRQEPACAVTALAAQAAALQHAIVAQAVIQAKDAAALPAMDLTIHVHLALYAIRLLDYAAVPAQTPTYHLQLAQPQKTLAIPKEKHTAGQHLSQQPQQ